MIRRQATAPVIVHADAVLRPDAHFGIDDDIRELFFFQQVQKAVMIQELGDKDQAVYGPSVYFLGKHIVLLKIFPVQHFKIEDVVVLLDAGQGALDHGIIVRYFLRHVPTLFRVQDEHADGVGLVVDEVLPDGARMVFQFLRGIENPLAGPGVHPFAIERAGSRGNGNARKRRDVSQ